MKDLEPAVRAIARDLLGRDNLDDALLAETAARVQALLARVRAVDPQRLQALAAPFSFDPTHGAHRTPPPAQPAWAGLAQAGPGGSGYGGTTGATGTPQAPPVAGPQRRFADPPCASAAELAAAIRRRELSPVEATRAALDAIAQTQGALNAFVTVLADDALAAARAAEAAVLRGDPLGPLHGVPFAVKDLFEVKGHRTTCGSAVMAHYVSQADATAVQRLRAAGAILVGKTATHEFAFGPTTDSPYHGPVRNPHDLGRVAGGSSGGSGAAVAAGIVPLALGTDTGGSIRNPAALCGCVGLKPSYGRVSKAGVFPLSWSLDHPGPLTRTVADAALALAVLAGPDPLDPTALPLPGQDYVAAAQPGSLRGLRLGVPANWMAERVDEGVRRCFAAAVQALRDLGAEVEECTLPPSDVMMVVNRLITLGEAGAYHADLLAARGEAYGPDVRARLELGQFLLARDYLLGQRLRGELTRQMWAVMARYDALLTPTMPIPAAQIGQGIWTYADGSRETVPEAYIRTTAPFSVSGQPGLSVPCGFTPGGLPVGLQIVGRAYDEATVLRIGAAYAHAARG